MQTLYCILNSTVYITCNNVNKRTKTQLSILFKAFETIYPQRVISEFPTFTSNPTCLKKKNTHWGSTAAASLSLYLSSCCKYISKLAHFNNSQSSWCTNSRPWRAVAIIFSLALSMLQIEHLTNSAWRTGRPVGSQSYSATDKRTSLMSLQ